MQFGICCVLAPSFADIFYENAFRNGLLVGRIGSDVLADLDVAISAHPQAPVFAIALSKATIAGPDGTLHSFTIPRSRAQALLRGDDEIAVTLGHLTEIEAFYKAMEQSMPWLYRSPGSGWHSP